MTMLANLRDQVFPDASAAFRRFPLAILMAALLTLVIISKQVGDLSSETMARFAGGTILAGYVSVLLTLYGEGRGKTVSVMVKAFAVITALLAVYYYRSLSFVPPMAIGAAVLFLGSVPFWRQKRDDVAVWDFTHKLWTAVVFTIAGSVIYLLGMVAISSAMKNLFGIRMDGVMEDWLLPIGFALLAPIAWLSMLPRHDDDGDDGLRNPGFVSRAVGFLGAWILAPLTLIYAVILLAYGVKIVVAGGLPEGEIAALVTPFLIVGTLTWLVLDPPFIQEKRLARWYHKTWFWLMIPVALLLLVSAIVRIGAHGVTIERYLLILASIWALGISAWFIVKGEKGRDIRIIPGFAALLLALGCIGPWGADGVSTMSQTARLKSALIANDMLGADGYLKPATELVITDEAAGMRAKGALEYLSRNHKNSRVLRYINPAEPAMGHEKNDWTDTRAALERFGVDGLSKNNRAAVERKKDWFERSPTSLNVVGFDHISREMSGQFSDGLARSEGYEMSYTIGEYTLSHDGRDIVVNKDGLEQSRLNIIEWLDSQERGDDGGLLLAPRKTLYQDGDDIILVMVVHQANLSHHGGYKEPNYAYLQYHVLSKGITPKP